MAETKLIRELDEAVKLLKEYQKEQKAANQEAKVFDQALKIDPGNFDVANRKITSLQTNIKNSTEHLKKMREMQASLDAQGADKSSAKYKKLDQQIISTTASISKMEKEVQDLNREFASGKFDKFSQGLDNINNKLTAAQQKLQPFARAAQIAIAAIAGLTVAFVKQGDAIDKLSQKYNVSAEMLQRQQFIYDRATGSAENYQAILDKLNRQLASARNGSAQAIMNFEKLGITQEELAGMSLNEAYDRIMASLQAVADETERANLASELLGNQGLYLAQVAALEAEEIAALNAELEQNGIMTGEQAAAAATLADTFTNLKQQVSIVVAEFIMALLPAIQSFFSFLQSTAIPWLQKIVAWFSNLSEGTRKAVVIFIALIAVLPKLIAIIKAAIAVVKAIDLAMKLLSANPAMLFIMAIVAAIWLLIKAWNKLKKALGFKVEEDDYSVPDMSDIQNTVTGAADVETTERLEVDISVEVTSDQPISETIARQVADDVVQHINTVLQRKVQAR